MSPLRRLHGWRAPGINTHRYRLRVCGVCERGHVFFFFFPTSATHSRYERSVEFIQFVLTFYFLCSTASLSFPPCFSPASSPNAWKASSLNLTPPFREKKKPKQHSGGTFQLPRRRQIKQGCAGEIPPSPFSFEFVIARRGVAVCRHTLGSVK